MLSGFAVGNIIALVLNYVIKMNRFIVKTGLILTR